MKGSYFGFFHGVLTELWISPRSFDSPSDLLRREFAIRSGRVRRRGSQIGSGQYFGVGIETIRVAVLVKEALASCCGVNLAGGWPRGGPAGRLLLAVGGARPRGPAAWVFSIRVLTDLRIFPRRSFDCHGDLLRAAQGRSGILRLPLGSAARCSGSLRTSPAGSHPRRGAVAILPSAGDL